MIARLDQRHHDLGLVLSVAVVLLTCQLTSVVHSQQKPRIKSHRAPTALAVSKAPLRILQFFPDGTKLAATDERGGVYIIDVKSRLPSKRIHGLNEPPAAMAISPDGTKLALTGLYSSILLWDISTDSVRHFGEPSDSRSHKCALAFSSDNETLGCLKSPRNIELWGTRPPFGTKSVELASVPGTLFGVMCLSGDGKTAAIANAGYTVQVFDTTSGEVLDTIRRFPYPSTKVYLSSTLGVFLSDDGQSVTAV